MADPVLACLLLGLPGRELPDETAAWLRAGLGGVIVFARNFDTPGELRRLCDRIREHAPEAIVACDEEGGEVTRLQAAGGSSWPGARVLGTVDDVSLTHRCGRELAVALAGAGVTLNLAPVADVATDPANPVIGNRSFGADPALVGRHVAAFVRGSQEAGVAACAKHFPGHGPTTVDSHLDLPVIGLTRDALLAEHLPPFADAVAAGAAALMTAHALYPALDDVPATISPVILSELARGRLGFDGVVVTDALTMGAIAGTVGIAAGALAALAAGADLLCVDGDTTGQAETVAGLRAALASGELSAARVDEAAGRVRRLAQRFPARAAPAGGPELPPAAAGRDAARRALHHVPLPAALDGAPYVLEVATARTGVGDIRTRLLDALRRRAPATDGRAVTADDLPEAAAVLAAADGRPLVIGTRDAFRRDGQRALVEEVLAARPDAVVVGLASDADEAIAAGRFIPARGSAPPNLDAVAEVLLAARPGITDVMGRD